MGKEPIDWKKSCTFTDYVVYLFARKETESAEFQVLLRIFGREKLEKIWREYRQLIKTKDPRLNHD